MGEDRVAVLLFYHSLCLIHVSKHFTNSPLHMNYFISCNSILGNTSVHTCSGPLKQQRLMYMGNFYLWEALLYI